MLGSGHELTAFLIPFGYARLGLGGLNVLVSCNSLWFLWSGSLRCDLLGRKIGRAAHMVLDTLLRAHTKRTLRLLGPPMLSSACSFVVNRGGAPKIEHVASSSEALPPVGWSCSSVKSADCADCLIKKARCVVIFYPRILMHSTKIHGGSRN